jgi:probable phosphoglycerate mutase
MPHSRTTRILAIRHGETAWNVDKRIQGQLDIGLNATGRWQAERLAEALASGDGQDGALDLIYSSDLSRAFDTASALARASGWPLRQHTGLRERHFGAFQGRTPEEVAVLHPEQFQAWRQRDADFCPEGGESLRTFQARCVATAAELAERHLGGTIALVAHGGVLDCLYRAASGMSIEAPRSWQLGNASINRLLYTEGALRLIGWGDTQHLDSALDEIDEALRPRAVGSLS